MSNDSGRVSIDQDKVRRARKIQKESNNSQAVVNQERLSTLPPKVVLKLCTYIGVIDREECEDALKKPITKENIYGKIRET